MEHNKKGTQERDGNIKTLLSTVLSTFDLYMYLMTFFKKTQLLYEWFIMFRRKYLKIILILWVC